MANEFLQLLKKDHEKVKGILEEIKNKSSRAEKSKKDLFMKLKQELVPHMQGEEKHFYPALKGKKEAKDVALEALEEHHVAEMVLKELDGSSVGGEEWSAKLKVFKEIVEHHIQEEEDEVFDAAEDSLSEDDFDDIMEAFNKEKEKVKKSIK